MHVRAPLVVVVFFAASAVILYASKAVQCNYTSLAACPITGCAKPGTPNAVTNSLKRTTAINGSPAALTFDDMRELQADVDAKFANGPAVVQGQKVSSYRNMKAAARTILLSGLQVTNGKFSEGDFVELSGYIASQTLPPHPNTGESVNCNFTDEPRNDYHINITPAKNSDETQGVIVEMIPQDPHRQSKDWTLPKLLNIQEKQILVRVQGRLFFDSEHRPNTQKTGKAGGNPRRFSLWEIHPISSFFVCASGNCSKASGWTKLEAWQPAP